MANKKASKKDIRTNERNKERNKHFKSILKSAVKKAVAAVESKSKDAENLVKIAIRQVDKTISKGILHKNTGARKKSSLAKLVSTKKA